MSATVTISAIVKEYLAPLLRDRGFTASGTTFRRRVGDAVQVVNIQRGSRNSAESAVFYLNGAVYLPSLDTVVGAPVIEDPDEPSCHVRLRQDDVVATAPGEYAVAADTDGSALGPQVAGDLGALIERIDGLVTPDAAVAHLATRRLAQYERVYGWYLSVGDGEAARRFVDALRAEFGDQPRWAVFARRLDAVEAVVSAR